MNSDDRAVAEDADSLGLLAMQFRGTRDEAERRAIADDYARVVARLAATGAWEEVPPPEDQLPYRWMPPQFFAYWSDAAGEPLLVAPATRTAPPAGATPGAAPTTPP